jgi:hypothetical protein
MSFDLKKMALAGYAALMGVDERLFSIPGTHVVETTVRESPEWTNWVIPIWFLTVDASTVCSVSPAYRMVADKIIAQLPGYSLLSQELAPALAALGTNGGWTQREIFIYPSAIVPEVAHHSAVMHLRDDHGPYASRFLKVFDGGVFAFVERGQVVSHAGIKNKGALQEIAVGTLPEWQRRGLAKAAVAAAIHEILTHKRVAVYVPDELSNYGSYALAQSLGFEKFAETLQWSYELDPSSRL